MNPDDVATRSSISDLAYYLGVPPGQMRKEGWYQMQGDFFLVLKDQSGEAYQAMVWYNRDPRPLIAAVLPMPFSIIRPFPSHDHYTLPQGSAKR